MQIKFMNSVVFVKDVDRSKKFYTEILGQTVIQDYGRYVGFGGGFGIWDKEYAMSIIFPGESEMSSDHTRQMELYFESDDLDGMIENLRSRQVIFMHDIHTHDWGQRGIRIQDPDGAIIEISEPMVAVIRRFFQQGLNADQIAERTGMPVSEIEIYQ